MIYLLIILWDFLSTFFFIRWRTIIVVMLRKIIVCCPLGCSFVSVQADELRAPISILLRREDEELGPGQARAGYRVSGIGLAWEEVFP